MTEHMTDEGPQDFVDAYNAQQITRDEMIDKLKAYPYTEGTFYGLDAYIPGSFDDLVMLALEGSITENELHEILEAYEN